MCIRDRVGTVVDAQHLNVHALNLPAPARAPLWSRPIVDQLGEERVDAAPDLVAGSGAPTRGPDPLGTRAFSPRTTCPAAGFVAGCSPTVVGRCLPTSFACELASSPSRAEKCTLRQSDLPVEIIGRHAAWQEVYSVDESFIGMKGTPEDVSYTHLDVYKRQELLHRTDQDLRALRRTGKCRFPSRRAASMRSLLLRDAHPATLP